MGSAISRQIEALEREAGLKGTDIANMTSVSKATVSRWKNGTANPQPANELRVSDLRYVVSRLQDYYSGEEIRLWLISPHPQLDGQRALDLIHQNRAVDVLEVIARLDAEAYL